MAITINFPASPVVNDLYSFGVKTWKWDGVAWNMLGAGLSGREILTAPKSYFVRTDGSNSNDGSADTAGKAFLTIQRAIDVASATLDGASFPITINVAAGTYTEVVGAKEVIGASSVTISGDSVVSTSRVLAGSFSNPSKTLYNIKGFSITTAAASLIATAGGILGFSHIQFNAVANAHVYATSGGKISSYGPYTIAGGCNYHLIALQPGSLVNTTSSAVTLTGTPAFAAAYANAYRLAAVFVEAATFSGSATGKRYDANTNGLIFTGAASTYLPGSVAGTTATGGQYA